MTLLWGSRYIVIITPFADHIRELFPDAIEPSKLTPYWQGRLFVVPIADKLQYETLRTAVSIPPQNEGLIEAFYYHNDQNYTTYCNEEFLFSPETTLRNPLNWIIREEERGIAGSIVITQGLTRNGDTPAMTENRLARLLRYFREPDLSGLWDSSRRWRQFIQMRQHGIPMGADSYVIPW